MIAVPDKAVNFTEIVFVCLNGGDDLQQDRLTVSILYATQGNALLFLPKPHAITGHIDKLFKLIIKLHYR
jgi:hypothetical protein